MNKFEIILRVIWSVFGYILILISGLMVGISLLASVAEGDRNSDVPFGGIGLLGIIVGGGIVVTGINRSVKGKDGVAAYGCLSTIFVIFVWVFGLKLAKFYLGY